MASNSSTGTRSPSKPHTKASVVDGLMRRLMYSTLSGMVEPLDRYTKNRRLIVGIQGLFQYLIYANITLYTGVASELAAE